MVTCIRSSPQLRDHISTTQFPKNKQNDLATSMYPKMSYVNELLLIAEARKVVWENMGIDQAVNVPKFPSDLIYGLISLGIHSPVVFAVYVSDKMDQKLTDFFKFVSARSQLVIDLYNEEAASAGEDLVASEAELMEAGSSFKVTDSASIASDTSHVPVSA